VNDSYVTFPPSDANSRCGMKHFLKCRQSWGGYSKCTSCHDYSFHIYEIDNHHHHDSWLPVNIHGGLFDDPGSLSATRRPQLSLRRRCYSLGREGRPAAVGVPLVPRSPSLPPARQTLDRATFGKITFATRPLIEPTRLPIEKRP
jgi:hypothetical protein